MIQGVKGDALSQLRLCLPEDFSGTEMTTEIIGESRERYITRKALLREKIRKLTYAVLLSSSTSHPR
jgi:hypothetical protein